MSDTVKTEIDAENDKVLEKFNFLIDKYHHYDRAVVTPENVSDIDKVPVLTECVKLRSKHLQAEFDELSPLRLLLDAALVDANIELGPADRQALVHALENRIIVQEKVLLEHQN
ncbi:hypothetical protein [Nitrosomonas sp.]|uniref:hypothetical protein n=1 Tax=Nitrosomonas sp. TaxID=42353 RepID=UPI001D236C3E|nr:hypothetical protein [Nitrosomonas sp.]MCB1948065.1 hypothetical protein [Nitrosomonas sp.]MCP5242333.1 hypothetical protein [Burkholderiales bacterium]MDR4514750.1 hypothetical protein [Nitrosomonas sp.]